MFDEDFVKEAAFVEPSHKERSRRPGLAARWAQRRRRKRMVAEWRSPEYRRSPVNRIIGIGIVVAVAAGFAWTQRDRFGHSDAVAPLVTQGAPSSGPAISLADPFAGSPAQSYATGLAGIVPPAAQPVGRYSADQVRTAYTQVRRLLAAAALDRKTLTGGRPDAFGAALGRDARPDFFKDLSKGKDSSRYWVVSLAPGSAAFPNDAIKVKGTMSATAAVHSGVHGVDVKVDYLFVYPIERPGRPSTLERMVVRVTGTVLWRPGAGLWLIDWSISPAPAQCGGTKDGYIHPSYDDSASEGMQATGAPLDPYDQSKPEPADDGCHQVSRT